MTEIIHYEDNIFYIHLFIKKLQDGLKLDIDPNLFIEKYIEDILFIHQTIFKIHASLQENLFLLKKKESLHSLLTAGTSYIDFLNDILKENSIFYSLISHPLNDKIQSIKEDTKNLTIQLKDHLKEEKIEDNTEILSHEELSMLLETDNEAY